ncbi:MAG TPA: hypothetical protein GXZ74_06285 [Tissierellia bacterium]|nr:hypothetical protein [Tissierellia bacterium]
MEWKDKPRSTNVEDRRGQSRSGGGGFSGPINIPIGGGGSRGGLGGIGLILLVVFFLLRSGLLGGLLGGGAPSPTNPYQEGVAPPVNTSTDDMGEFASVNLRFTEDVWTQLFREANLGQYQPTTMVLFSDYVQSACGQASSAMGPFYCPADGKVYIDLSFYNDLQTQFGVEGHYAMSYVIFHEVGHHVQNLLGVTDKMEEYRRTVSQTEYNRLSVRLELQADYLAGVVTKHLQDRGDVLQPGDIEAAINAAEAIGDDRIQKQSQGYVVPDSFTHGTSEQRVRWFMKGYESGSFDGANTFNIPYEEL